MTNIDFLNYINGKVVKHKDTNIYYVYIGAIYGYDDSHGYDNGLLFEINNDLITDVYSIENILVEQTLDSEYIHKASLEEIENGLFNTYIPVRTIDFNIYKLRNDMNSYQYTEYELNNFAATFMKIIQYLGNFSNDNMNTSKNQIYKRVIDFYANGQTDNTLIDLTLLLKSESYTYNETTTMSMCGCSDANTSTNLTGLTDDCASIYQNAMLLYLKQMLSDLDFYYDFFHIDGEPIEDLIDGLIRLIEEFKTLGYDLSFDTNKTHCGCSKLSTDNRSCNYNILDNYIRVLNWIKESQIEEHTNQIKIYGEQFAELLPKLQF